MQQVDSLGHSDSPSGHWTASAAGRSAKSVTSAWHSAGRSQGSPALSPSPTGRGHSAGTTWASKQLHQPTRRCQLESLAPGPSPGESKTHWGPGRGIHEPLPPVRWERPCYRPCPPQSNSWRTRSQTLPHQCSQACGVAAMSRWALGKAPGIGQSPWHRAEPGWHQTRGQRQRLEVPTGSPCVMQQPHSDAGAPDTRRSRRSPPTPYLGTQSRICRRHCSGIPGGSSDACRRRRRPEERQRRCWPRQPRGRGEGLLQHIPAP